MRSHASGISKAIKERDGVLKSEQIRRAINDWLQKKGVMKAERKRAVTIPVMPYDPFFPRYSRTDAARGSFRMVVCEGRSDVYGLIPGR
jgi:hypothetical protein